jgi:hypothetical protein
LCGNNLTWIVPEKGKTSAYDSWRINGGGKKREKTFLILEEPFQEIEMPGMLKNSTQPGQLHVRKTSRATHILRP